MSSLIVSAHTIDGKFFDALSLRIRIPSGLLLGLLLLTFTACTTADSDSVNGTDNALTTEEEESGWELLFDGESLEGWRGLNREGIPHGAWVVENETLKGVARDSMDVPHDEEPPPRGDLLLDRTLNDFELTFDFKLSPVANSGIKYNVSEELSAADGNPHSALGFEYQVLDDPEYPEVEDDPTWGTAALYELVAPNESAHLNEVGTWNTGRIVFDGTYGEHWLNGERVLTFDLDSREMDSALAESKWSDNEEFGQRRSDAYLVLQDHGDTVWYRNLELRKRKGATRR